MIVLNNNTATTPVKCVLFDFDGTISTFRHGWESVMRPLFLEKIEEKIPLTPAIINEVDDYIDQSTGIQTILQMKWLREKIESLDKCNSAESELEYKRQYNERLMDYISDRINSVKQCYENRLEFLIEGSEELLKDLTDRNVELYIASGTDHPDVVNEVETLGLTKYFTKIVGAPVGEFSCSKEKVIKELITRENLCGDDFAVIGDGKVEIRLGHENNARTVGVASDEENRHGINDRKTKRLIDAGADVLIGDFNCRAEILEFLGYR